TRRPHHRRSAGSPWKTAEIRGRRPARRVHPARDGSPDRQALRRLPLAAETRDGAQEARQAAPRRVGRLNSTKPLRVPFAATPDFAVPHLRACSMEGVEIVAVYTQPDRPAGRGRQLAPSPVKQAAIESGYRVEQPESLKGTDAQQALRDLDLDLFIVV